MVLVEAGGFISLLEIIITKCDRQTINVILFHWKSLMGNSTSRVRSGNIVQSMPRATGVKVSEKCEIKVLPIKTTYLPSTGPEDREWCNARVRPGLPPGKQSVCPHKIDSDIDTINRCEIRTKWLLNFVSFLLHVFTYFFSYLIHSLICILFCAKITDNQGKITW